MPHFFIILFIIYITCSGCETKTTPEDLKALQQKSDWKELKHIMLNDSNPLIRAQIPYYLVKIQDENISLVLIEALKRHDTMNSAARCLAQLKEKKAIPYLIEAYKLLYGDKKALLQDISTFIPETEPFLIEILQSSDWNIKNAIIGCLAERGNITSVPALQKLYKEAVEKNKNFSNTKQLEDLLEQNLDPEVLQQISENSLIEFIKNEIPTAIGKIQFRYQLLSVENLLKFGWKRIEDNKFSISSQEYFKKNKYIVAYQTEWILSDDMLGYTLSELTTNLLDSNYYIGRGTISNQKNSIIFDGFYYFSSQEKNNNAWPHINMVLSELICDFSKKEIYFAIFPKDKKAAEPIILSNIKDFLTMITKE